MKVRLLIHNMGFQFVKEIDMPAPPTVGLAIDPGKDGGPDRDVTTVTYLVQEGLYEATLGDNEFDAEIQSDPQRHLMHLDTMKRRGWRICGEVALRQCLSNRIDAARESSAAE
jgi:hypothetical protein